MLFPITLLIIVSIIYLYVIQKLERRTTAHLLIGAMIWGAMSFGIAFLLQNRLLGEVGDVTRIQIFSAPVLEELLKALPLLLIIHARVPKPSAVDGFAVGLGFALVESTMYMMANPDHALVTALVRVVSIHLIHGFTTGLTGLALSRKVSLRGFAVVLVSAMLIHAAFNLLALNLQGSLLVITAAHAGAGSLILLLLLIDRVKISTPLQLRTE